MLEGGEGGGRRMASTSVMLASMLAVCVQTPITTRPTSKKEGQGNGLRPHSSGSTLHRQDGKQEVSLLHKWQETSHRIRRQQKLLFYCNLFRCPKFGQKSMCVMPCKLDTCSLLQPFLLLPPTKAHALVLPTVHGFGATKHAAGA